MPNRVVHFEIEAQDTKRAEKFYSEAFGWNMEQQGPDYGSYVVAQTGPAMPDSNPKNLGINGGIYSAMGNKKVNAYRCVIGVDDIDKAIDDVKKAGGKVMKGLPGPDGKPMPEKMDIPKVGIWAICEDTEENIFSIMQPYPGDWMSK